MEKMGKEKERVLIIWWNYLDGDPKYSTPDCCVHDIGLITDVLEGIIILIIWGLKKWATDVPSLLWVRKINA